MNYDELTRLLTTGSSIGASNWNRDLEAAKRGEGDFGVPMPNMIMTRATALINMNRAQVLQNIIQEMLDTSHQDVWDSTPMKQIIGILKQTVYAYQVFIAELDNVAIPERPVEVIPDTPTPETPTETPGILDWVKANPIPVLLGALFLVNLALPKNKKLIKL